MKKLFILIFIFCTQQIPAQDSSIVNKIYFDSMVYKKPEKAYDYALELLETETLSMKDEIQITKLLGDAAWVNGDLILSAEHYLESLRLIDSTDINDLSSAVHGNLGNVFNDLGAFEMAKREYRYGFRNPLDVYGLNNMATVFIREEQYDSALFFLNQAFKDLDDNKYFSKGLVYYNLGVVAKEINQMDSAEYNVTVAKTMFEKAQNKKMFWTSELTMAQIFFLQDDVKRAVEMGKQVRDSAKSFGFGELSKDAHAFLYEVYKKEGKEALALSELEKQIEAEKSLKGENSANMTLVLDNYFQQKQRTQELETINQQLRLSAALQSEKAANNALITILIGILVVAFNLLYRNNQRTKRRNLELTIERDNQEKLVLNLQHEKDLSEQKEYQLHLQEKQLLTYSLKEVELNEFLSKVTAKLEDLEQSILNLEVVKMIKQYQKQSNPWDNFKTYFEGIHESFFSSLSSSHSLTSNDLKLSALSVLGFSSKQMADIMGIKPSSIDISRHRLRKKLDLEAEQSLTEYLRSFLK